VKDKEKRDSGEKGGCRWCWWKLLITMIPSLTDLLQSSASARPQIKEEMNMSQIQFLCSGVHCGMGLLEELCVAVAVCDSSSKLWLTRSWENIKDS